MRFSPLSPFPPVEALPGSGAACTLGKAGEKLSRQLLRHAIDQARADLGELPPDVGLGRIGEECAAVLRRQRDARLALGKTCSAALTLEVERVGARWIG